MRPSTSSGRIGMSSSISPTKPIGGGLHSLSKKMRDMSENQQWSATVDLPPLTMLSARSNQHDIHNPGPATDRIPNENPFFHFPVSPMKDKRKNAAMSKLASKAVKDAQTYSRLSGTVNYTGFDGGAFVDRGQTVQPSILCVRCATHASVCMQCCDLQTQEALRFYRKSIGKGASAILNSALKDAGLMMTTKRVIFNLWKNSMHKQMLHIKQLTFDVGVACDRKYMRPCFAAWRKNTKDEIIERKNKQVKQAEEKVEQMTRTVEQVNEDKAIAVKVLVAMKDQVLNSFTMQDKYVEQIKKLEVELETERNRVLAISSLVTPIINLSEMIAKHNVAECAHYDPTLVNIGHNAPSQNWHKMYPESTRDVILRLLKKREDREKERAVTGIISSSDWVTEMTETLKIMVQWINYTSRMVMSIDLPTSDGDAFDSLLPRHEQIYDITQLKTGRTLARIVFALIYFGAEMDRTTSAENNDPKSGTRPFTASSKPAPGIMGKLRGVKLRPLSDKIIAEMKNLEDDAEPLIELSLNLASSYLGIPLFKFLDIHRGDADSMLALVGSLMFATMPSKEESDLLDVKALLEEQARMHADVGFAMGRLGYATRILKDIHEAVDKYWGVEPEPLPEPEPVVVAQVPPPSEGQELPTGDKEISETGTGVPPSTETTTATTGEAGTSDEASATLEGGLVATVTRKASIPQVEETPLQKYNRVAFVVDALAASNEPEMLRATIVEMDDHVRRLGKMRESVLSLQIRKEEGMRLATDVKTFAMSNWIRTIVKPMQMID